MKRALVALTLLALPGLAFAVPGVPAAQESAQASARNEAMDAAQFRDHRVQAVMRMDADHDGRVSQAEFSAMAARRQAAGHEGEGGGKAGGGRMFAKLDLNHDGYLSGDEVSAFAGRRFAKLDANHDGKLDADERAAAHHGHGGDQPTGF